MGVPEEEFWTMSPRHFGRVVKAFSEKHKRSEEAENRRVAWICATLMNTAGKTYKRTVTADDLLKGKGERFTKAKWEELKRKFRA